MGALPKSVQDCEPPPSPAVFMQISCPSYLPQSKSAKIQSEQKLSFKHTPKLHILNQLCFHQQPLLLYNSNLLPVVARKTTPTYVTHLTVFRKQLVTVSTCGTHSGQMDLSSFGRASKQGSHTLLKN